jgi:hypothetical protein
LCVHKQHIRTYDCVVNMSMPTFVICCIFGTNKILWTKRVAKFQLDVM